MTDEQRVEALKAKHRAMERIRKQVEAGWSGLTAPGYYSAKALACKKCGCTLTPDRYAETKLAFSDGSAHITPLCHRCTHGLSQADLEAIYCADLLALADDEERTGVLMFWQMMADRKPTGHSLVR